jgi:hypothetical protein
MEVVAKWKEGQGTEETDKAIPEAWNWKLKGSKSTSADGWWHASGVCRVGGDRFCGEAGSTSI